MRFHLQNQTEVDRATAYLASLAAKEVTIDIKRVHYPRSLRQNAYLHTLLAYFATQAAYTLAEAKDIYKQMNAGIYHYEKHGYSFYRSSADLDKAEMTQSIERFREWSAEQGIDLPAPSDTDFLEWAQDMIAMNEGYL